MTTTLRRGRTYTRRAVRAAVPLALLATGALAAPAGAISPARYPTVTVMPEGDETKLVELEHYRSCASYMPDMSRASARPLAGAALSCVPPFRTAKTATLVTPGTFELRSSGDLARLEADVTPFGADRSEAVQLAAVKAHGTRHWTLRLPQQPRQSGLRLATYTPEGTYLVYYLVIEQPPAAVALTRARRRGDAVNAVARTTPGELSAYLTVAGRRRGAVVRTTVARAGTVRLQIPLGRRLSARTRSGGVTVVLRPADGQPAVRSSIRWSGARGAR